MNPLPSRPLVVGDFVRASNPKATPRWEVLAISAQGVTVRNSRPTLYGKTVTFSISRITRVNPEFTIEVSDV